MSNTFVIFYGPFIVVALSIIVAFWVALKMSDDY